MAISAPEFNNKETKQSTFVAGSFSMARVFGYMAIALLFTAIISTGIALLMDYLCQITRDSYGFVSRIGNEGAMTGFAIGAIPALIIMIVCSVIAGSIGAKSTFSQNAKEKSILPSYILYVIAMGYLFGFMVLACPWQAVAIAFGITVVVYGALALVGYFSKGNLNPLMTFGVGLIVGAGMIALMNLLFMFLLPSVFAVTYWIVEFAILIFLLITTCWDVWQIKQIAQSGMNNPNLVLFCSFRLYVDFMAILIRVLYYVAIILARTRR